MQYEQEGIDAAMWLRVADVAEAIFDRLYADMGARGLSAATIRQAHAVARKALADAVRKGLLASNPADTADVPTVRRHEPVTWTADDLATFLTATASTPWGPLFRLAAMTGMRRGEVLGLRWGDVDFDAGTVTVRRTVSAIRGQIVVGDPKTPRSRRSMDVDAATMDALRPHRGLPQRHVFGSEAGPWHPDSVTTAFDRAVDALDVPRIRLHDIGTPTSPFCCVRASR